MLITDATYATYSQARLRDEQLMTNLLATLQGFIFNFSVGGRIVPPLGGELKGGGQQSVGGGMARDPLATFDNSRFKPSKSF
jgi:hypothetical protein